MKINLTIEISPEEIFSAIRHMDFQEIARLAQLEKVNTDSLKNGIAVLRAENIRPEALNGKLKPRDILIDKSDTSPGKIKNTNNPKGISSITAHKKCEKCGNDYHPKGNAQRLCPECRIISDKKKESWSKGICVVCHNSFEKSNGRSKYCSESCLKIAKNIQQNEARKKVKENACDTPAKPEKSVKSTENKITGDTPAEPVKESWYMRKKREEREAKEEAEMLESLKEHEKIDWKKAKLAKGALQAESISI